MTSLAKVLPFLVVIKRSNIFDSTIYAIGQDWQTGRCQNHFGILASQSDVIIVNINILQSFKKICPILAYVNPIIGIFSEIESCE
jgi:hypothetical protein